MHRQRRRKKTPAQLACIALIAALSGGSLAAQERADAPTAKSVLGFEIGERPATYAEILRYCAALAAQSNRVRFGDYGVTSTGRKLPLLTISAPENLARLEETRQRLARLGAAPDEGAARRLMADLPAVMWLGYGIHGSEISASDAALQVAYRLAGADDAATTEILRRLILYIDPVFNVDGRTRSLNQLEVFSRAVPSTDPQDILQAGQWPPGRGNHYFFDLNRDALYTVLPEARARVAAIVAAQPQILIDGHEMGIDETHLFAVPAAPFNPNVPAEVHKTWADFAAPHAEAFDAQGLSYYTRSWNEVFYPGYFDILLAYHGGTPIIYEQAGNGGTTVSLPNGRERTYAQSVENHVRSSFADLTTAAAKHEELLWRWWAARRAAATDRHARTWLILPSDHSKQARLAQLLRTQGVRVERLERALPKTKLHSIWGGLERALPAGTLRVSAAQPLGGIVRNVFDFHTPMAEPFLQKERRSLDASGASMLFDVTAWDVPHAFDAEIYWVEHAPRGAWQALTADADLAEQSTALPPARYGYLYKDPSLQVTARLLDRQVRIRIATEAFVQRDQPYAAGDFVIRLDDQVQPIAAALAEAQSRGARLVAADSARAPIGPDLGDHTFRLLKNPRIALLIGPGTNAYGVGEVWRLLDVDLHRALTMLDVAHLTDFDLSRYDVIVLPDGDSSTLQALLARGGRDALETWTRAGGTLIAFRGGARALIAGGKLALQRRRDVLERYPPWVIGRGERAGPNEDFARGSGAISAESAEAQSVSTQAPVAPVIGAAARPFLPAGARTFSIPRRAPNLAEWLQGLPEGQAGVAAALLRRYLPKGAYLQVDLREHWLSYGMRERVPALFREDDALVLDGAAEVAGSYGAPRALALSGLVWPEAVGYIANTAYVAKQRWGAGQLVLFANDPIYRGYSLGTQRLFTNALILGPSFRAD